MLGFKYVSGCGEYCILLHFITAQADTRAELLDDVVIHLSRVNSWQKACHVLRNQERIYRISFQNAVARQGLPDRENPFRTHGGAWCDLVLQYCGNTRRDKPASCRFAILPKSSSRESSTACSKVYTK